MAEFDETLNSILHNPAAMEQITQLAQSLAGPSQTENAPPGETEDAPPPEQQNEESMALRQLLPLLRELGGPADSNARRLLYALRPYLKPERQQKIERALRLARMYHLAKQVLSKWEG